MRRLLVSPWPARHLVDLFEERYSSVVASVGFEPRCTAIAASLGGQTAGTAVEFAESQVLGYFDNRVWFENAGWTVRSEWGEAFLPWIRGHVLAASAGPGPRPRIAIDVSSMTRTRIAALVQVLCELPAERQISVDLLYAPAPYTPPPPPPAAFLQRTPVSPYFAGGLDTTDVTVVLGLGYEQHKAASTIEDFGPVKVVAFVPEGRDDRYLAAVRDANQGILRGPTRPREVLYPVHDPYATFSMLEALTYDALVGREGPPPAMVPLGPKIFAACCLLVAALYVEHVAVWRVSFGARETPVAHAASGEVYGLRIDVPLLADTY